MHQRVTYFGNIIDIAFDFQCNRDGTKYQLAL